MASHVSLLRNFWGRHGLTSQGGNNLPFGTEIKPVYAGIAVAIIGGACISRVVYQSIQTESDEPGLLRSFFLFFYSCFIKPHQGDQKGNQQDALESFYSKQAGAYDATRGVLLRGREDMLSLVAAQLEAKATAANKPKRKRVWVDIGGGTGYNIEAMGQHVDVPSFFTHVYLVDFSPSLCEVATKRFQRLGWNNVTVVCEDARKFRLEDYENGHPGAQTPLRSPALSFFNQKPRESGGADLITMSYSLSMIPDYYSVVDSVASLMSPDGLYGVVDFYVQNQSDFSFRNFTGGLVDRHVNFLSRAFWRSWFDLDRVALEAGRRDYLEYKYGTLLSANCRNRSLGYIPYYIWVGCHRKPFSPSSLPHEIIERIDALATESPLLVPAGRSTQGGLLEKAIERSAPEIRSKAFVTAVQNLSASLPLPSFFYQNHHWRIYYDDQLKKHTQFNDEYIYAFTWEDARVDERILKLGADDKVIAISSAGDNIMAYLTQSPARVHAVDLNPTQNHLLELKAASYTALPYEDFWLIFGEGKHPNFRDLLQTKLSPHLSSRAFQYWLKNVHVFQNNKGYGLYNTGGSRHAIRVFRWVARLFGLQSAVHQLLSAKTLNEQREIWRNKIRPALLSKLVCNLVVAQESFLWAALGVPKNQLAMIEADHANSDAVKGPNPTAKNTRSHAIWHYMVNTLDPVAEDTHIAEDNPYYYVCMAGKFSPKCHPEYLSPKSHAKLSKPGALDGLRIHTDELEEVIARITPGTLTVAVVMDSMDWFDPGAAAAEQQITKLNRALAMGGRVMLRSSALHPWYIKVFEANGFVAKSHGQREGTERVIDRVNMYASCWICTKAEGLRPPTPEMDAGVGGDMPALTI